MQEEAEKAVVVDAAAAAAAAVQTVGCGVEFLIACEWVGARANVFECV